MKASKAEMARYEYVLTTGKCPTCGVNMKEHPKCDGCGAATGLGHENIASRHRGHTLCGNCIAVWRSLEKRVGQEISWTVFLSPQAKHFEPRNTPFAR